MTRAGWNALEERVNDEVCRGRKWWIFRFCDHYFLSLDRKGRIRALPPQEGGVGGAIGRLLGRAFRVRLPSALATAVVRLPLLTKTQLTRAGALPSSALTRLPAYGKAGRKTTGILDVITREFPLISGRPGYAPLIPRGTPGFNAVFRTHVEGHAIAYMRLHGIRHATLYINRLAPCLRVCQRMIPRALPKGYVLRVVTSDRRMWTYESMHG
jgi:hypothetical protein